jgi:hypothetical protein
MRRIPPAIHLGAVLLAATFAIEAQAREFRVEDVPSDAKRDVTRLPPGIVLFSDTKTDAIADPATGLVRFEEWSRARPTHKRHLGLHAAYAEPTVDVMVHGLPRKYLEKLHVYIGRGQFTVSRPIDRVDFATYATLDFLQRLDPSIVHRQIEPSAVAPLADPAERHTANPSRAWCGDGTICVSSRYQLEGKLPLGIRLANKLEDSGKKIAEHLDFQSELRITPRQEVDQAGLSEMTGVATPISGVLEQTIFWVNQMMQYGRFIAVFQPHPADEAKTIVTAFMALGIETDVLEKKKEFERVPVLRNMVPAQVLVGNSSFNTGTSISAGVPVYARNRLALIAGLIDAGK